MGGGGEGRGVGVKELIWIHHWKEAYV